jgi:hypothetical protein
MAKFAVKVLEFDKIKNALGNEAGNLIGEKTGSRPAQFN